MALSWTYGVAATLGRIRKVMKLLWQAGRAGYMISTDAMQDMIGQYVIVAIQR